MATTDEADLPTLAITGTCNLCGTAGCTAGLTVPVRCGMDAFVCRQCVCKHADQFRAWTRSTNNPLGYATKLRFREQLGVYGATTIEVCHERGDIDAMSMSIPEMQAFVREQRAQRDGHSG